MDLLPEWGGTLWAARRVQAIEKVEGCDLSGLTVRI